MMQSPMALGTPGVGTAGVAALYPPGSALLRLIQMYDAMAGKGSVNESQMLNLNYWKSLVQEFYMPDGFFRQVAWNPTGREQRAFELPVSVLARYYHTMHLSGVVSTAVTISHPREWSPSSMRSIPPPPQTKRTILGHPNARTTHFVQVDRIKITVEYDNGWIVVHSGLLRAGLTPFAGQLKFQFVDFLESDHESYVARAKMRRGIAEQPLSDDLIAEIRGQPKPPKPPKRDGKVPKKEGGGSGGGGDESSTTTEDKPSTFPSTKREDGTRFTMPVERWSMPEDPVNEYGMTLRAMRCLEITESVCQLRGLMDYAAAQALGPMDALQKLAEEFRASRPTAAAATRNANANGNGNAAGAGAADQVSPNSSNADSGSVGDTSSGPLKRKMQANGANKGGGGGGNSTGGSAGGSADDEHDFTADNESSSPNKRAK